MAYLHGVEVYIPSSFGERKTRYCRMAKQMPLENNPRIACTPSPSGRIYGSKVGAAGSFKKSRVWLDLALSMLKLFMPLLGERSENISSSENSSSKDRDWEDSN